MGGIRAESEIINKNYLIFVLGGDSCGVDVVEIAGLDIQRTPHYTLDAEKDTVDGVAGVDDRMVVIIDAEKVLDEGELKGLARSA